MKLFVISVLINSIKVEFAGNVNFLFRKLENQYSPSFLVSVIQTLSEIQISEIAGWTLRAGNVSNSRYITEYQ